VSIDGEAINKKFNENWSKDFVSKLSLGNTYSHMEGSKVRQSTINTGDIIFQPYSDGTNIFEKNTAVLPFRRLEQKGRNKANTGTNGPKACAKCGIAGFTDNDSDG